MEESYTPETIATESIYGLRNREVFFENDKRERGRVKHAILKVFFQAWLPISGYSSLSKEIIYVDGFAGTGRHTNSDENGSPLVVYNAAVEHCHLKNIKPKLRLIFVEHDKSHAKELELHLKEAEKIAVKKYRDLDVPNKIIVEVKQKKFEEFMIELLQDDESQGCPMLIFADPFGYSEFPYEIAEKLAQRPRTDVFLTFMDSYMNRFVKDPSKEQVFDRLYGPKAEWRKLIDKEDRCAADFAHLYKTTLEDVQNNLLFLMFGMRDGRNRHVYHLIYFTKHRTGIEVMKKSMAKESQETLAFNFSEWSKKPLRSKKEKKNDIAEDLKARILEDFSGTVIGSQLENYVWLETPYCFMKHMCTKHELKQLLADYISEINRKFENIKFSFPTNAKDNLNQSIEIQLENKGQSNPNTSTLLGNNINKTPTKQGKKRKSTPLKASPSKKQTPQSSQSTKTFLDNIQKTPLKQEKPRKLTPSKPSPPKIQSNTMKKYFSPSPKKPTEANPLT